jgi:hypothetical protein
MIEQFKDGHTKLIDLIHSVLKQMIKKYVFETERFVIYNDLGHSMMRKTVVSFELDLIIKFANKI